MRLLSSVSAVAAAFGVGRRVDLNPHRPTGTPARPANNVIEGKTRGERKRTWRAWANNRILEEQGRAQVVLDAMFDEPVPVYEPTAHGLSYEQALSLQTFTGDRYRVVPGAKEDGGGFYIVDDTDIILDHVYKERKTANRRAKQLNGG